MKERPILFSAPMVRAILEGRKTQTRRVVKPIPAYPDAWDASMFKEPQFSCPYGQPGDLLWIRETWATSVNCDGKKPSILETPGHGYGWPVWFRADDVIWWRGASKGGPAFMNRGIWRPSIHMPRWASRITLEVTGVRVERLQDISEEDAIKEGVHKFDNGGMWQGTYQNGFQRPHFNAVEAFSDLWQSLNGNRPGRSWNDNPWVWVVEFKRIAQAAQKAGA